MYLMYFGRILYTFIYYVPTRNFLVHRKNRELCTVKVVVGQKKGKNRPEKFLPVLYTRYIYDPFHMEKHHKIQESRKGLGLKVEVSMRKLIL